MSEALRLEEMEELDAVQLEPITNDAEADEAIQKIVAAEDKVARMKEWFMHQLQMITESSDAEIEKETMRLRAYFDEIPHNKTKTQESYVLPHGKLVLKDQEPDYDRDDDKIIKALKEKNLTKYVKVKESLDWAALKRAGSSLDGAFFLDGGIQIPGIKVVDRDKKFMISK
jgi:hypothetical protein